MLAMSRVIHFEIHAQDVQRAVDFYTAVFGWKTEDWSGFVGMPYVGVTTGEDDRPGINGAIMEASSGPAGPTGPVKGAVLTMGTDDFDATRDRILEAGGQVALGKHALPGMAWQGYFLDTEGNVFGVHQPDPEAQ